MVLAAKGNRKLYWVAAVAAYIFSFIAGFSIGQLTIGLVFIPLLLAIGYTLNLIKNKIQAALFLLLGIATGVVMVLYVDDAWLFFPFRFFS
jgi:sulfite exporter TauE/SafE